MKQKKLLTQRKILLRVLWFVISLPFAYAIAILLGLLFNSVFHTGEKTVWFIILVALVIAFFLMRLVVALSIKKYQKQALVFKAVLVLCAALSLFALFFDTTPDETMHVEMCFFDAPFNCADFGVVGEKISARLISTESIHITDVTVEMVTGKTQEALSCGDGCGLMLSGVGWNKEEAREFSIAVPGLQDNEQVELLLTITLDREGIQEEIKGSILVYP